MSNFSGMDAIVRINGKIAEAVTSIAWRKLRDGTEIGMTYCVLQDKDVASMFTESDNNNIELDLMNEYGERVRKTFYCVSLHVEEGVVTVDSITTEVGLTLAARSCTGFLTVQQG